MIRIKDYILLYCAFLVYSLVAVFSKYASLQENWNRIFVFLFAEVLILGVYAILWQQILKRFSLVHAMASKGIVVILNLLWSVFIFEETVTICNVIGAGIVILGIWVVSRDA